MNTRIAKPQEPKFETRIARSTPRASNTFTLLIAVAMLTATVPAIAQAGASAELQQKVAAVKQSVAENQQKLHQYQWTETTQLALKGDAKPPSQSGANMVPTARCKRRRSHRRLRLQAGGK